MRVVILLTTFVVILLTTFKENLHEIPVPGVRLGGVCYL